MTQYGSLIHLSRYARWDDDVGRRETWDETVERYFSFFVPYLNKHHNATITAEEVNPIWDALKNIKKLEN